MSAVGARAFMCSAAEFSCNYWAQKSAGWDDQVTASAIQLHSSVSFALALRGPVHPQALSCATAVCRRPKRLVAWGPPRALNQHPWLLRSRRRPRVQGLVAALMHWDRHRGDVALRAASGVQLACLFLGAWRPP